MYTKVYASLITSSVWSEDPATCKVWVTMMAMADRAGFVFGSVSGLARICALPIADVETALRKFLSPDPYSSDLTRQPENEGRRVEIVEGGWRLLNHTHYRDLPDAESRRAQVRDAVARLRDKKKSECNQPSSPVITSNQCNQPSSPVSPSEAGSTASAEAGSTAPGVAPSALGLPLADPPPIVPSADPAAARSAKAAAKLLSEPKGLRVAGSPEARSILDFLEGQLRRRYPDLPIPPPESRPKAHVQCAEKLKGLYPNNLRRLKFAIEWGLDDERYFGAKLTDAVKVLGYHRELITKSDITWRQLESIYEPQ